MVKGTSKQVIVVRPEATDLFEQAIFILRDPEHGGITDEKLLEQARKAADSYLKNKLKGGRGKGHQWSPIFYAAMGGLSVGGLWIVTMFLF